MVTGVGANCRKTTSGALALQRSLLAGPRSKQDWPAFAEAPARFVLRRRRTFDRTRGLLICLIHTHEIHTGNYPASAGAGAMDSGSPRADKPRGGGPEIPGRSPPSRLAGQRTSPA